MGDDVKDEPAKPKETTFKGKAGWLKKCSGKFLGSYKDRYIQLDKTEIAVYENEDLKNCLEHLDLENYDKCHELRSPFKKKYRLILIRTPKSTSKVCDIKLQAQNQEEKEAWIKALSDGINRAKNKIFDEVKVDESLSLDHVTRSRPKGNRGRRPPTRIHMKETANISSDGILRLDLDISDNMPNGAHIVMDGTDGEAKVAQTTFLDAITEEDASKDTTPIKKVLKPPMPPSKENKQSESEDSESKHEEPAPQKKVLIPPMPPSKENKRSESEDSESKHEEPAPQKKVLIPPMPPSKENKRSESEDSESKHEEPAPQKKVLIPPMPPSKENKRSESEDSESKHEEPAPQKKVLMPPMPPSKDQKPSENREEEKGNDREKVVKPPMPPSKENKPRISASEDAASENVDSEAETKPGKSSPVQSEADGPETVHPPSLPSKDIKPKDALNLNDKEILSEDEGFTSKENEEDEFGNSEVQPFTISNNVPKPQGVMWDSPSTAVEKSSVDQNANKSAQSVVTNKLIMLEPAKPATELKLTPHSTPETVKKSAAPPAPPKKKPLKPSVKTENQAVQNNTVESTTVSLPVTVSSSAEDVPTDETKPAAQEPKEERKVVILSLSNSGASEDLDNASGVDAEVKSIDSGQLSAEDSEISEQITPSSDKLHSSLEVLDGVTSEEELEMSDSKVQEIDDPLPNNLTVKLEATMNDPIPVTVESKCTPPISSPAASLNSSLKKKSASTGDLLEEMTGLQSKVSMELGETEELLGKIAPRGSPEDGQDSEGVADPELLLATAMEKLKKADQFLREAKSYKEQETKSNRTSW